MSFSAAQGEVLALMGPSGAGKTTVLRAIAGLDAFTSGSITVDGLGADVEADRREYRRRVGMVFQFHHLFSHLNALENVCLAPVHVLKQPRHDAEARARERLIELGIGERAQAMPNELSGGEAQRVAIARALAMEPSLLLMDEPTASLDPARRLDLADLLRRLAAARRTVVVATHDAEFAQACADRVLTIEAGAIRTVS
jgi:ABC-type polar amino acid transport system ATPase subunit